MFSTSQPIRGRGHAGIAYLALYQIGKRSRIINNSKPSRRTLPSQLMQAPATASTGTAAEGQERVLNMCTAIEPGGGSSPFLGTKLSIDSHGAEGGSMSMLSPCANLGRDFELLVNRCIAEKRAQEKKLSLDRRREEVEPEEGKTKDNMLEDKMVESEETPNAETADKTPEDASGPEPTNQLQTSGASTATTSDDMKNTETAAAACGNLGEGTSKCHNMATEFSPKAIIPNTSMAFSDDSEWPLLGCACRMQQKQIRPVANEKAEKSEEKKKPKSKRVKKWKPVSQMELGFSYSVLAHIQFEDVSLEEEIGKELQVFEELLANPGENQGNDIKANPEKQSTEPLIDVESKTEAQETKPAKNTKEEKLLEKKVTKKRTQNVNKRKRKLKRTVLEEFVPDVEWDHEKELMLKKVPSKMQYTLGFEGLSPAQFRLRRPRKWRRLKTHKAIKSKQCRYLGVMAHGQLICVSHHIHKKLGEKGITGMSVCHCLPGPKFHEGYRNVKERMNAVSKNPVNRPVYAGRNHPANRREYPIAQPRPRHALDARNADAEIPDDILNVLMALQERDLTPEDYEVLLRLDERVKPKTLEEEILESFRTEVLTAETAQNISELCAVCLEPYLQGHKRKFLPCDHGFHGDCIDMWLKNSSMNCPLDGLPVDQQ